MSTSRPTSSSGSSTTRARRRCQELGLAGFGLKSHYISTAERAAVVAAWSPGSTSFGAIDAQPRGRGLNALAVEIAAREGARIVWLPTVDAVNETEGARDRRARRCRFGCDAAGAPRCRRRREPVSVVDERARAAGDPRSARGRCTARLVLRPATSAVTRSSRSSTRRSRPASTTIVVTHPEFPASTSRSTTRRARRAGALLERCYHPHTGKCPGSASSTASARPAPSAPCSRATSVSSTTRPSRTGSRCSPTACSTRASATRRSTRWPCQQRTAGGAHEPPAARRSAPTRRTSSGAPAARSPSPARAAGRRRSSRSPTASAASRASCGSRRARRSRTSSGSATPRPSGGRGARRDFRRLDFGDYPLEVEGDALTQLVDVIREFAPDVIVTHTDPDPFNPDHPVAFAAVERARALAAGAGVPSAFATVAPPALFLFEPHQPELCNFTPTTFVDITAVIEGKREAMAAMGAQQLPPDLLRPARRAARQPRPPRLRQPGGPLRRGLPARDPAGGASCDLPSPSSRASVGDRLRGGRPRGPDRRRPRPGRAGLARGRARPDGALRPGRQPDGARGDGPLQPGDVLVLTMPEPEAVALVRRPARDPGPVRGAAALLVDAAVRDVEELASSACRMGALGAGPRRGQRRRRARSTSRSGRRREIRPGRRRRARRRRRRWSSPSASTRSGGALGSARSASASSAPLQAGALSYDLDGLRARVEG